MKNNKFIRFSFWFIVGHFIYMWHSDYIVQKFFILGLLLFLICLIMSLGLIFMLFRRMFVKQYNILQKFILLVALGYFIWWLNGGIDDLKYQVYKEKREEVVKMILEGECGVFNPTLLLCLQEIADILKSEVMDTSPKQETKNIQDIRNKIDYDRLFSYEKYTVLPCKQRRLQLLYIDSLTNVYNRRYYDEFFQGSDDIQAMAVIDADNFKHINDNYGHDVGDIVLKSIAQTVLSCIRKTDAVIRYGGDEFVIVFYSIPADVFEKRLERIRYSVNSLILDDLPEQHISVSIGGCYGIGTAKKLFKVADDMMYQSKNTKNKVTVCFRNEKAGGTDNI